ncbi:hypothetical protein [Flavobacterium sp. SM2513]|uniref:hypothetical protein n=1 Tax=Flavobacterium sp. SM2513 TaxID=3424766 RepID=UPI003D7FFF8D
MKQFFTMIAVLLFSLVASAQEVSLEGKWSETKFSYIDTLNTGRYLVAKDFAAYAKGEKKLPAQYFELKEVVPKDDKKRILTITKKDDFYLAKDQYNFNQKITYNPTTENYLTIMNGNPLVLKIDPVTKRLSIIEPISNITYFEFKKM